MEGMQRDTTEDSYYAQYGDVQPAMDGHDPSGETDAIGESSLNGNALASIMRRQSQSMDDGAPSFHASMEAPDEAIEEERAITQPEPSPPSTSGSNTVARLEQTAEALSGSEIGIKQHIGTTVKSLFRLARSSGMSREEFESTVKREMDVLQLMERDD